MVKDKVHIFKPTCNVLFYSVDKNMSENFWTEGENVTSDVIDIVPSEDMEHVTCILTCDQALF